ncbi:hypothetical protein TIFTF001_049237 [Ficus carica]|uniref:Uncharacterized protein n=1 Tax=Ficus carica TaxID=3494 RepID=A0AA87Z4Y6_FICCA|nr:hypothetical protein TIFTF001_049237 [Ficus carica]
MTWSFTWRSRIFLLETMIPGDLGGDRCDFDYYANWSRDAQRSQIFLSNTTIREDLYGDRRDFDYDANWSTMMSQLRR